MVNSFIVNRVNTAPQVLKRSCLMLAVITLQGCGRKERIGLPREVLSLSGGMLGLSDEGGDTGSGRLVKWVVNLSRDR